MHDNDWQNKGKIFHVAGKREKEGNFELSVLVVAQVLMFSGARAVCQRRKSDRWGDGRKGIKSEKKR